MPAKTPPLRQGDWVRYRLTSTDVRRAESNGKLNAAIQGGDIQEGDPCVGMVVWIDEEGQPELNVSLRGNDSVWVVGARRGDKVGQYQPLVEGAV